MNLIVAYIDPGAGSLFIQALIGGVLAGLYAIKLYWTKLKLGLTKLFSKKNPPSP
jgi:hypothetical protein